MSRILTAALSALALTGCANNYDKAVRPEANIALKQASEECKSKSLRTFSERASCNLAAERAYFTAIKLKDMDRFEAYAAKYQTLAVTRDAKRISDMAAMRGAVQMRRDFYNSCNCAAPQEKFASVAWGDSTREPQP